MTVQEYLELAAAGKKIYDVLAANKPAQDTLAPEEKAEVDAANSAMNDAVSTWNAAAQKP
jgi:hypothetical protein